LRRGKIGWGDAPYQFGGHVGLVSWSRKRTVLHDTKLSMSSIMVGSTRFDVISLVEG
jgi:hypothetical protein